MAIKGLPDGQTTAFIGGHGHEASESFSIIKQIHKEKGAMLVTSGRSIPEVPRVPTGMFEFDLAIGGGFPRGRYSIIYGPEGSGKSNACYCAAANAQRMSPDCNKVVWVDVEGTFDPNWAVMFGVDVDALILVKPAYGEEMNDMVDALIRAKDVMLVVVDSLGVVVSTKELEQSAEKFDVGTSAILIKRMVSKIIMALELERRRGHVPAVILINQTRFKIGVMFGDPETIPGGQALKFLSSLTIRVYGKNKIMKEVHPDLAAFKETHAVVKKAKVPITALAFDYDMCVYPHDTLDVGQTRSWGKVMNDLKQLGNLIKTPKGWQLSGEGLSMEAPTLVTFQDTYEGEPEFALKCQNIILASYKGKMFLAEKAGGSQV